MPLEFISIPTDAIDKENIIEGDCTHPAGHCFGSDGGSGIPEELKVPTDRGGEKEVWTLSINKKQVLKKEIYSICQYCLKYTFKEEIE